MNYQIRPMRQTEYPLLDDFLYEAIFIPEGVEPPPRDILQDEALQIYVRNFGSHPGDACLCAEADGRIVGAVWVRYMHDYGYLDDETPSLAISLYPEWRGQGIGTALMEHMLQMLSDRGIRRVSLSVQKENYAVRMYRRTGFVTVRETDEEYLMLWQKGC
ncbi:MAG: GNAT family N-acetyltransferase [Oscillospiraceae bacterium]|nr:GNAT family N-acetyltransferase [Oscillospiraceae bacterium]